MSELITPTRVLKYQDRELADLNPGASIEDVLRMHATLHPELSTAILEGPIIETGRLVYTAQTRLGTKG